MAYLIVATLAAIAIAALVTAWAVHRLAVDRGTWTTAANVLAQRITDHDNRITRLEETR